MYLKLYMKTRFVDQYYSCAKQADETVEEWLARAIVGVIEAVGVNYMAPDEFKHKMASIIANNLAHEQRDKLKRALEEEAEILKVAHDDVYERFKTGHVLTSEDRELLLVYLSLKTETRDLLKSLEST